jgi:hypothetical protein
MSKKNVIKDALAADIHAKLRRIEYADQEWAEQFADLAELIFKAREKYPADQDFGRWWTEQDFRYHDRVLDKDDRAAFVAIGERLHKEIDSADSPAFDAILEARSRNPRPIAKEIKERFRKFEKPTDELAAATEAKRAGAKTEGVPPLPPTLPNRATATDSARLRPGWKKIDDLDDDDEGYERDDNGWSVYIWFKETDDDGDRWFDWEILNSDGDVVAEAVQLRGLLDAQVESEAAARKLKKAQATRQTTEPKTENPPPKTETEVVARQTTQHVGDYQAQPAPGQKVTGVEIPRDPPHGGSIITQGGDTVPIEGDPTKPFDVYARQDARTALRALYTLASPDVRIRDVINAAADLPAAQRVDRMVLAQVFQTVRDLCAEGVDECRRDCRLPTWTEPKVEDVTDRVGPEGRAAIEREATTVLEGYDTPPPDQMALPLDVPAEPPTAPPAAEPTDLSIPSFLQRAGATVH